jgi:hypothetical protein
MVGIAGYEGITCALVFACLCLCSADVFLVLLPLFVLVLLVFASPSSDWYRTSGFEVRPERDDAGSGSEPEPDAEGDEDPLDPEPNFQRHPNQWKLWVMRRERRKADTSGSAKKNVPKINKSALVSTHRRTKD